MSNINTDPYCNSPLLDSSLFPVGTANFLDRNYNILPYLCQLLQVANDETVNPVLAEPPEFDITPFTDFSGLATVGDPRVSLGVTLSATLIYFLPRMISQTELLQSGGSQIIDNFICDQDGNPIKESITIPALLSSNLSANNAYKYGALEIPPITLSLEELLKPITTEEIQAFVTNYINGSRANNSEYFLRFLNTWFLYDERWKPSLHMYLNGGFLFVKLEYYENGTSNSQSSLNSFNPSQTLPSNAKQFSTTYNGTSFQGYYQLKENASSSSSTDVILAFGGTLQDTSRVMDSALLQLNTLRNTVGIKNKTIISIAYSQDKIIGGINNDLSEAEAALLWLKSNPKDILGINVNKIYLFGHSQGGYIVVRLNKKHKTDGIIANAPGPINLQMKCQDEEKKPYNQRNRDCNLIFDVYGSATGSNKQEYLNRSLISFATGQLSNALYIQGLGDDPFKVARYKEYIKSVSGAPYIECIVPAYGEIKNGQRVPDNHFAYLTDQGKKAILNFLATPNSTSTSTSTYTGNYQKSLYLKYYEDQKDVLGCALNLEDIIYHTGNYFGNTSLSKAVGSPVFDYREILSKPLAEQQQFYNIIINNFTTLKSEEVNLQNLFNPKLSIGQSSTIYANLTSQYFQNPFDTNVETLSSVPIDKTQCYINNQIL